MEQAGLGFVFGTQKKIDKIGILSFDLTDGRRQISSALARSWHGITLGAWRHNKEWVWVWAVLICSFEMVCDMVSCVRITTVTTLYVLGRNWKKIMMKNYLFALYLAYQEGRESIRIAKARFLTGP